MTTVAINIKRGDLVIYKGTPDLQSKVVQVLSTGQVDITTKFDSKMKPSRMRVSPSDLIPFKFKRGDKVRHCDTPELVSVVNCTKPNGYVEIDTWIEARKTTSRTDVLPEKLTKI